MLSGENKGIISICHNEAMILEFLNKVDKNFPTPLSKKVNLEDFVKKVTSNGYVIAVEIDGKIVSAAFFYCNDIENKNGYLTVLATLPEYEGNGYAAAVVREMEKAAKEVGMLRMYLHTERVNARAVEFYIRNGYCIVNGENRIRLMKEL